MRQQRHYQFRGPLHHALIRTGTRRPQKSALSWPCIPTCALNSCSFVLDDSVELNSSKNLLSTASPAHASCHAGLHELAELWRAVPSG